MSLNKIRTIENLHTIKRINYNKLTGDVSTINWSELSQINDPNIVLNNLIDKIKICLSKAEYTKIPNKTNVMKPRKDWVTKAIMISSKTKEKLYKLWKKDPYNNRKREEYKNFTNILKNIINKAKDLYDKIQIEASMNSPKRIWIVIYQEIGKNRLNLVLDIKKKHKSWYSIFGTD